ncbi:hypothetical protein [Microbacterium album]|uniref:Uncharacterized protein n=1 Tax=Microbacterium album TaxID=2053191 RepID=A0A917MMY2_9MICO|nr:hypothetical protein [Microbacterium album]GGH49960.1 hypothetical protein GCM10010921_28370 [Microbacterium album]
MANTTGTPGTIVSVVGPASDPSAAERVLANLEGLEGVETLSLRDTEPAIAAHRIAAATRPWIVHDADPLQHVAAAWVELFEERSTLGVLEVEIEQALAHFAGGTALMPDYYIVLEPEDAPDTWRHWWCGALGHRAPRRILPARTPDSPLDAAVRGLLKALPASRPWPEPATWLPGLAFEVPDRIGLRDRAEPGGDADAPLG